jgi:hypothetical protein
MALSYCDNWYQFKNLFSLFTGQNPLIQYPRNIGGVSAMRAALIALMLTFASQAGAAF